MGHPIHSATHASQDIILIAQNVHRAVAQSSKIQRTIRVLLFVPLLSRKEFVLTPAHRGIRISTDFAPKYRAKQVTTNRAINVSNATQLASIAPGPPAPTVHLVKITPTWPIANALAPAPIQ